MNEFSFIKFTTTVPTSCTAAIPVPYINDLAFFTGQSYSVTAVAYTTKDGSFYSNAGYTVNTGLHVKITDTSFGIQYETDKCFRIRITCNGVYYYSNLLRYINPATVDMTTYSLIGYQCTNDRTEFGFPYYITYSYNQLRLPVLLKEPQFPEESVIYKDRNGVRRVLSASIDFEYTLETDFMPVEWHQNLVIALGHDYFYIEGVQYQKNGEYEVNYEDEYITDCGQKLYKATAKVLKNITQRNTNC